MPRSSMINFSERSPRDLPNSRPPLRHRHPSRCWGNRVGQLVRTPGIYTAKGTGTSLVHTPSTSYFLVQLEAPLTPTTIMLYQRMSYLRDGGPINAYHTTRYAEAHTHAQATKKNGPIYSGLHVQHGFFFGIVQHEDIFSREKRSAVVPAVSSATHTTWPHLRYS